MTGGVEVYTLNTAFLRLRQLPKGWGFSPHPAGGSLEIENNTKGRVLAEHFQALMRHIVGWKNVQFLHLKEIFRILPHCNYHPAFQGSIMSLGQFSRVSPGRKDKKEDIT